MIVEFSLGNYRSFNEVQTLHLQAAKIKSKYKSTDINNVFEAGDKYSLLKSKIIYGANASGKSNLIRGMAAMLNIIRDSFKDDSIIQKTVEPFRLSKSTLQEPTFFQISFILENVPYRYGMQLKDGKICDEWLFGTPGKKEVYFFIREGLSVKVNENQFKEALKILPDNEDETPIYGESALFLTVAAASKRPLAEKIASKLTDNTHIIFNVTNNKFFTENLLRSFKNAQFKTLLSNLLRSIGIEINTIERKEIDLKQFPKELQELFISIGEEPATIEITRKMNTEGNEKDSFAIFDLGKDEAEGTKKMIALSPYIFSSLLLGQTIIIDEFDAKLHPRLSRKIIELFNSNETNPKNAQLIVISHDTNLMDAQLFRRDQIGFVEQDEFGASQLYSLVEYKGIRNNASFEKDYLKGKYGAVPFLNAVDNLFVSDKALEDA
ncbi:MAG: AAA family ATPase [Saprospiraceae bacterium]